MGPLSKKVLKSLDGKTFTEFVYMYIHYVQVLKGMRHSRSS
jgi:hypothetical protein